MTKLWMAAALFLAMTLNGCACFPLVWWQEEECELIESSLDWPDWSGETLRCEAEMESLGVGGFDRFSLTVSGGGRTLSFILPMAFGTRTDGEFEVVGSPGDYYMAEDEGTVEPGELYAGVSGTVVIEDFSFEAGANDLSGPLGLNRLASSYGKFQVTFRMEAASNPDGDRVTGSVTAKGDKQREFDLFDLPGPDVPGDRPCADPAGRLAGTWKTQEATATRYNMLYFNSDNTGRVVLKDGEYEMETAFDWKIDDSACEQIRYDYRDGNGWLADYSKIHVLSDTELDIEATDGTTLGQRTKYWRQ